ncbi:hypothetical protein C2E23DRAFT_924030 [Lenzites betulinus]|nr:hypothetical protein C2E23DRAFT_924030 [Lenzites betulinus]
MRTSAIGTSRERSGINIQIERSRDPTSYLLPRIAGGPGIPRGVTGPRGCYAHRREKGARAYVAMCSHDSQYDAREMKAACTRRGADARWDPGGWDPRIRTRARRRREIIAWASPAAKLGPRRGHAAGGAGLRAALRSVVGACQSRRHPWQHRASSGAERARRAREESEGGEGAAPGEHAGNAPSNDRPLRRAIARLLELTRAHTYGATYLCQFVQAQRTTVRARCVRARGMTRQERDLEEHAQRELGGEERESRPGRTAERGAALRGKHAALPKRGHSPAKAQAYPDDDDECPALSCPARGAKETALRAREQSSRLDSELPMAPGVAQSSPRSTRAARCTGVAAHACTHPGGGRTGPWSMLTVTGTGAKPDSMRGGRARLVDGRASADGVCQRMCICRLRMAIAMGLAPGRGGIHWARMISQAKADVQMGGTGRAWSEWWSERPPRRRIAGSQNDSYAGQNESARHLVLCSSDLESCAYAEFVFIFVLCHTGRREGRTHRFFIIMQRGAYGGWDMGAIAAHDMFGTRAVGTRYSDTARGGGRMLMRVILGCDAMAGDGGVGLAGVSWDGGRARKSGGTTRARRDAGRERRRGGGGVWARAREERRTEKEGEVEALRGKREGSAGKGRAPGAHREEPRRRWAGREGREAGGRDWTGRNGVGCRKEEMAVARATWAGAGGKSGEGHYPDDGPCEAGGGARGYSAGPGALRVLCPGTRRTRRARGE